MARDMLARRLERQGFRASTAASGQEAICRVAEAPFDLVMLDIEMPGHERLRRAPASCAQAPLAGQPAGDHGDGQSRQRDGGQGARAPAPTTTSPSRWTSRWCSRASPRRSPENAPRRRCTRARSATRWPPGRANDGFWDWRLGDDRVYFSPRWKAMLGFEEGEVGDSPEEWFSRVHADDVGKLRQGGGRPGPRPRAVV